MEDTAGVVRLGMPYDQRPESKDLQRFLTDYCKYWRDIGLLLGLKSPVLDLVASAHPMQDRECFRATLEKWLLLNVGVTWSNLELAITNAIRESLSLQPLTTVPTSQSKVAVMQSHDNQPRQDDERSQVEINNEQPTPLVLKPKDPQSTLISVKALNTDFTALLLNVRRILSNCPNHCENLEICKDYCALLRVGDSSNEPLFSAQKITEIKECNSFKHLFQIISLHMSWDEHSMLTQIVDQCDSVEGQQEIEKFEEKLALYQGLEVILSASQENLSEDFARFLIVIDKPYRRLTIEEYTKVKTFIFSKLKTHAYAAIGYFKILYRSLHIEWFVTDQAVPHMIKNAQQSKDVFIKEGFIFMQIGCEVLIDIKGTPAKLLSSKQTSDLKTKQKVISITNVKMEDTAGIVRLGMPYDQKPESRDLNKSLTDYCKHWRGTGLQLGLKTSVLDQVEADHHTLSERFRVTLEKWLQLNVGVTWSNLELAITNANRESLGLQPLTSVDRSQSEVTDTQSHNSQPRQDDERNQEEINNVKSGVMVKCTEVNKKFRDFVVTRLQQKYSNVIKKLIHVFKENKVDIEELITILRFDDAEKKSIFSTDGVFNTVKTEIQLFQHVAQYCKGIYDYRVLDVLVQASGCPEAIKELTDFTESLHNSILTEIDLMSEHGELLHPDDFMPGTYKFIIEYVGGKCTIETKEMVQGIVEQSVRLNKGVLIFKGIDLGSILFIYQISEAVKDYLLEYKFTQEDVVFLEGNNIRSLIVDGVRIMSTSQPNKGTPAKLLSSKQTSDLKTKQNIIDIKMEDTASVVKLGMPHDQKPQSKNLIIPTFYNKYRRGTGLSLGPLDQVGADHHSLYEHFRLTQEKLLQLNVRVTWNNFELAITNANHESLGLPPLATVSTSQSEVTVMQSHDNQPRQDNERSKVDDNNVANKILEVKKRFRNLIVMKLQMAYSKVLEKIMAIFREKKVDVEELITILRFDDVNKSSIFCTDNVFNTVRTHMQLFQCVGQYCKGIYDYEVLNVLVQASDCPEAFKELTDFTESLHNSVLTEIDLMSEHEELLHPDDFMPGTYKFIIEYVGGKCTIETKEMVQGIVEQSVRLNKGVLIFKGVVAGSILFIYQISEAVKDYLLEYKFTEEDVVFLEGNKIRSLIVDGVRIMSTSQPNKDSQEAVQLKNMISKQLDKLVTFLSPKDREATLSALRRIVDNIIQHANDGKYRQIKLTDETFSSKVWQYPAGEELMKMSGWVVEDDHVRLRDDSCVEIISHLLTSFLSSATGVVPFPNDEFQAIIKAIYNGDILCIQQLLRVTHISPYGKIYSESGSSFNLLCAATIAQQINIVKLLLTDYSMDPYVMSMSKNTSRCYFQFIFLCAPQSFIKAIMKYCGVRSDFRTTNGYSLLHHAVVFNYFDVVCFLLEECSDIDVNVIDVNMRTPLHLAYRCGHAQIAQYLIQHGADVYAVDSDGHTPYKYIDGDPDWMKGSEIFQNLRKIHHIPYCIEHCYYMKLANTEIDVEEAVSLTMEQFPSLKEDRPTQPHDIDHASALKEFTQYITNTQRSNNNKESQEAVHLTNISKQLDELVTSLSPEDREATLSTLRRIFDNITQHPNDDNYRHIKLTDKTFNSKVWQYPAGQKLMKMSGWVVEDDRVILRDDSCVQIMLHPLTSYLFSLATGIELFPDHKFQVLIKALYNGNIPCMKKLLKVSYISFNGSIYSKCGFSFNLLEAATIAQQLDIVKLLLTDYSMDPYVMSMRENHDLRSYFEYIFFIAPQSFIIAIMKYCGVKSDFRARIGRSFLHLAVFFNCFDVADFLLEECSDIDVNVTNDDMRTPLHYAYLCGHTQIAQYLIQHGADVYAVDNYGRTPYEYIDGVPDWIKKSECAKNRRKMHHIPYSIEHCYYMKLVNSGIDEEEAVFLTMEHFPSLKEDGPTQPHHDIDNASAFEEFNHFIVTCRCCTQRSTDDSKKQTSPEVQEGHSKVSTDHSWKKRILFMEEEDIIYVH